MSREIRSPVYQIDFTAVDAGKRIASTKRRIRWRFGFTNQDALAAGETGTACRGEEHDITLIWSLTSGKRLVLADGQEVHYSNSRSQIFDFSWTMRGNHVLKVVAHGTTPMNAHPTFRQYDFYVDGMSFFSMPKVYRLGLTDTAPIQEPGTLALAQSSRRGNYSNYSVGGGGGGGSVGARTKSSIVEIETPHNEQEEEAYLREAIKASLSDANEVPDGGAREHNHSSTMSYNTAPNPPKNDDLLIDFMSEPAPAPTAGVSSAPVQNNFAMVPTAAGPNAAYAGGPSTFGYPPPQPPPSMAPVAPPAPTQQPPQPPLRNPSAQNVFAPAPVSVPPPQPTFPGGQFAPAPAPVQATMPVPAPAPALPTMAPPMSAPAPSPFAAPQVPAAQMPPAPAPAQVHEASPNLTMAPQPTGLGSDANAAYAKFASMDQFDLVKPKDGPSNDRANPFDDPVVTNVADNQPTTLADMKAMNQGGEKREVMRNSGSMVVAGGGSVGGGSYNNYGVGGTMPGYGVSQQPSMNNMGQQGQYQNGYQQQQAPPPFGMPQQPAQQQYQYQQPAYGTQPQQHF